MLRFYEDIHMLVDVVDITDRRPFWTRAEVLEALVVVDENLGTSRACKFVRSDLETLHSDCQYALEMLRFERRFDDRMDRLCGEVDNPIRRMRAVQSYWLRQALHILRYEAGHGRIR